LIYDGRFAVVATTFRSNPKLIRTPNRTRIFTEFVHVRNGSGLIIPRELSFRGVIAAPTLTGGGVVYQKKEETRREW
jgi:hypothetical protein